MKQAGELLSFFFDPKTLEKAQEYADIFASWESVVKAQRIPAAADHSRVVEFERQVLLIEADHPGWIQLLQTKQQELLRAFQRRFPHVTGISFRLSRNPGPLSPRTIPKPPQVAVEPEPVPEDPEAESPWYTVFEDKEFRATLKHLQASIKARNARN
ncbi:MAG: DUF721 domain-containing protein [Spirochaetaceae bacterium]|jgi:hypothetical protein|nr:DUF721 domain-containing protein [Spirochaetaceae bacterium]